MIFEPYKHGRRFFHFVPSTEDSLHSKARCLSCRKPKPFSQFGNALLRKGKPMLQAICFQCRGVEAEFSVTSHPLYTPELGVFFSRLHLSASGSAYNRGLTFLLSKDDLLARYLRNEGRCELTGVILRPFDKGKIIGDIAKYAPSIDRIDSSKGYEFDNIQIVAAIVNIMKKDMTMFEFVNLCRQVAVIADRKTDEFASEFEAMERGEAQPDSPSRIHAE